MRTAILIPIMTVALAAGALLFLRNEESPEEFRATKSGRDSRLERTGTESRDAEERLARITGLASHSPEEAEALAMKLEGPERDEALASLAAELARTDASQALRIASSIEDPTKRGNTLGFALAQLAASDAGAVFGWLAETVEDEAIKASAERMALPALAEVDPERVARWIAEGKATPEATEAAVVTTVQRWVQQDREAAAQWVAAFEDPRLLHDGMEALVSGWSRQDAEAPAAWIEDLPEGMAKDEACAAYAAALALAKPDEATAWAGRIKDPALAEQTARRIASAR